MLGQMKFKSMFPVTKSILFIGAVFIGLNG